MDLHTTTHAHGVDLAAYAEQHLTWPESGKRVLAQYTDSAVLVFQAYNAEIAAYAVANGRFLGAPGWLTRMTWVKPGFLWMMYRSSWATAPNQQAVLGVWLRREAFDRMLSEAFLSKFHEGCGMTEEEYERGVQEARRNGRLIRVQWDPDHTPSGGNHRARRAIQIGLKGLRSYEDGSDIVRIVDMTPLVEEQRENRSTDALLTPVEREYPVPADTALRLGMQL
eukprot:m51a1_g5733 hypothetical protein (224) ;mRNA; r:1138057-1138805